MRKTSASPVAAGDVPAAAAGVTAVGAAAEIAAVVTAAGEDRQVNEALGVHKELRGLFLAFDS